MPRSPWADTRLRIVEVFSLQWSNEDLKRKMIRVFAPKTGKLNEVPTLVSMRAEETFKEKTAILAECEATLHGVNFISLTS